MCKRKIDIIQKSLPSSLVFSPHLWLSRRNTFKIVIVETIAGIDLQKNDSYISKRPKLLQISKESLCGKLDFY